MSHGTEPGKPSGVQNIIVPIAMIGFAVYELTRRNSTWGVVWWGAAIAVGALLLLANVVVRVLGAKTPAGGAASIDAMDQKLYGGVHERRLAAEGELDASNLDRAFYDRATAALVAAGHRVLPDFVDVTANAAMPGTRAVLRPFLGADGTVMAAVYDVRLPLWMRPLQWVGAIERDLRSIDLETELDDGTFVATSNCASAGKTGEFPGLSRRFLTRESTVEALVPAHAWHLRDVLAARPGVAPLVLDGFEAFFASQDRQQMLKNRHRTSAAFDPAAEVATVAGRPLRPAERELADEAARLHADRVADRSE